ncbi:MAG: tetratricopeptide repeat-containing sensor histidine kinase [Flavobacteriaceae bacterium]|nr:tetratricopeptide repeat-containing sensor histidine kinase [Bacteroidia bacterium]NNL61985.1 tetratricopeptide repeat-containing sensor histidine kinase [Flavobacteriaceae bacterium]
MKQLLSIIALLTVLVGYTQTKEIDDLTLELAFQQPDTAKVNTSIKLIKMLYEAGEYEKALMFIEQSEQLAATLNYEAGTAEAIYQKAIIFSKQDDYFNAADNFNKSKKIFEKLRDSLGIAKVNNGVGLIEIQRGNYRKGLESSLAAISIFEKNNLQKDLSTAYNNLANAYYNTNELDKSLEFNFKALDVRESLNDSLDISTTLKNIASLYSIKKEHRKAIEYYDRVFNFLKANQDPALQGDILPKIGQEYLNLGEITEAADYLVRGLKYNRRIKHKNGLLLSLNSIGDLNIQDGQYKVAQNQLYEANIIAKQTKNQKELLRNYKLLMQLDSTKGQFKGAFVWQRRYQNLKDSLYNAEFKTVGRYETDYALERTQESFLEKQEAMDLANTKKIEDQKLIIYGLLGAVITALTVLLLIYLKRKNRLRYTKELEAKNAQIQLKNEEILSQSRHLEEINQVKDKLFSIVSHDLKDSITSIKGFLDLLNEKSITKEEFEHLVPELSENANSASLLLFNLLNWSKSQMESLEPNPELFDIQSIFHEKIKLVEQKIESKKIILIDDSQRDFVYADKSMVEIIIQNLLANAVKFSKSGDVITVSNSISDGKSLICIEDSGVGISKENVDKIFKSNSFTTIGTKEEKGTGLGLTICKELVELNKGRIWVESTENVGSKFYVELPKTKSLSLSGLATQV